MRVVEVTGTKIRLTGKNDTQKNEKTSEKRK